MLIGITSTTSTAAFEPSRDHPVSPRLNGPTIGSIVGN
jgi:hypothetical protein